VLRCAWVPLCSKHLEDVDVGPVEAGDLHIYRRFCQLTWQLGTAGNTCVLILWAQCGLDSGSYASMYPKIIAQERVELVRGSLQNTSVNVETIVGRLNFRPLRAERRAPAYTHVVCKVQYIIDLRNSPADDLGTS